MRTDLDLEQDERAVLIAGLATELGLSEQSISLLQEIGSLTGHEQVERLAHALADGERARLINGWQEASCGDIQGTKDDVLGGLEAVRIVARAVPPGQCRLIYTLYIEAPSGRRDLRGGSRD